MGFKKNNFLLIGVAGGTGSGKTTITKALKDVFGEKEICVVEQDSYYRSFTNMTKEEKDNLNFDHPNSIDTDLFLEDLQKLKQGKAIQKPIYDFKTHSRLEQTEKVVPAKIVIVDGILLFTDKRVRELFDIKVFVDTDSDIRVLRRIKRDMEERARTLDSVINQYLETVRPMHLEFVEPSKKYADIIIPEGGQNQKAIQILVGGIRDFFRK